MKKAFQIFRFLGVLSTVVLLACIVLSWGGENGGDHRNRSNIAASSPSGPGLNFAIFQDNHVFAVLPDSSKVITFYFHGIGSSFQFKLLVLSEYAGVVSVQFVDFFVRNICNALTSIHAP